jgi:hypothetical protein
MMSNVVKLADYREKPGGTQDEYDLEQLTMLPYGDAVSWAGADFRRLIAVAKARDYRPEWISHQLENHGLQPSAQQAAILAGMVAAAGPYVSRRQRWILRQIRLKPVTEKALATMASSAAEYRSYKDVPRCVQHDIARLTALGLVQIRGGMVHAGVEAPPEPEPQRRRSGAHAPDSSGHGTIGT